MRNLLDSNGLKLLATTAACLVGSGTALGQDRTTEEPRGERPTHIEADVRFMQGMITHHAQALEMTALVPERSTTSDILALARRIEMSQADEIRLMQRWLERRGERLPEAGHGHHGPGADMGLMPGMLTQEQMATLAAATGERFDRLFLESMIAHHEGALNMVEELFAADGAGQEPALFHFASHVDSDQRIEIERMRAMLDAAPYQDK